MEVLVVDDSAAICERLEQMLSEIRGVTSISLATNSLEAIESFRKLNPDLVILDIRMPGGDGIGVLKNIKQSKPSSKVIIFTNYPYPQYRERCMDMGADLFLDKSTEFNKLTEEITNIIESEAGPTGGNQGAAGFC